jgi:hypothetical protein
MTKAAINMTPTGQVNLPVRCPAGTDNCTGVVSVWVWYRVPHTHSRHDQAVAGDRGPSYRHKRRRRRVGRKTFNVEAGADRRLAMTVGANARNRACRQGKLRVDVIVRHKVAGEWVLTTRKLTLRPQRCPAP